MAASVEKLTLQVGEKITKLSECSEMKVDEKHVCSKNLHVGKLELGIFWFYGKQHRKQRFVVNVVRY